MQSTDISYLEQFAEYLENCDYDTLPEYVQAKAVEIIADSVAVMLAGSISREVQNMRATLTEGKGATLLAEGLPRYTDIRLVATINAIQMGSVELDEVAMPPGVHPALHVLPCVLALGEQRGVSGENLITAFAMGYEATLRTHRSTTFRNGIYPHGHTGTIGAVVGLGKILGWNAKQFVEGINIASAFPMATSFKSCLSGATVSGALGAGSIPVAFMVADMVEAGFTGDSESLTDTFGSIIGTDFSRQGLVRGLGDNYAVEKSITKFIPVCGRLYPVLEAVTDAYGGPSRRIPNLALDPVETSRIRKIQISVSSNTQHLAAPATDNPFSARFSIPFSVAVFLTFGELTPEMMTSELMKDSRIRDLESRISVEVLEPSRSGTTETFTAKVTIVLEKSELSGSFEGNFKTLVPSASTEEIRMKFEFLTSRVLGADTTRRLADQLFILGKQMSIEGIFAVAGSTSRREEVPISK